YIKDFALIDELEVSFAPGLNILTGQTGAGKSIIIGALNMILGERADTDMIRYGTQKAVAEAVMNVGDTESIKSILSEHAVDFGRVIILRREIRHSGSRAFINDTPVNIAVLRQVGDLLVDLHGQHDHQLLLKEENHHRVIDGFPKVEKALACYKDVYKETSSQMKELFVLRKRERELQEKLELYRFQSKELEAAELDKAEIEAMEAEMKLLDNAEDLDQKAAMITDMGSNGEASLTEILDTLKAALSEMAGIEQEFETYSQELNTAAISIQEMLRFTERYRANIEFNPSRLDQLRQQQTSLNRLEKKYGRTVEQLALYREELRENLNLAENFDLEIEQLQKKVDAQLEKLASAAAVLHEARVKEGQILAGRMEKELHGLGIPHASFEVRVNYITSEKGWITLDGTQTACTELGCDEVAFYISTNKGEQPKAMIKIASGGEISRVMLALKSIAAMEQHLPVMVFDEIDTGISGAVAERVGETMRNLSEHCQIVAITHQAQIAGQAHHHFSVEKYEEEDRTVTHIKLLSRDERIREIASIISGAEVGEHALASAREMIDKVSDE
ncbi:MAG: DNA repair protein RecN, partial [Balneolales bacterium]